MWSTVNTQPARRPGRARIAGRIRRLAWVLELALDVRRERLMLLRLDDRALRDIGLSRGEAWTEGCRPLWEIPCDRLWL
jgi:uncharacterized protein YjiS (DUF1127 family)